MPESSLQSSRPQSRREDALAVVKRLRDAGHIAYFAGGCVRDLLLGLEAKDYDVATDAPPDRVRKLFNNTQAVGAAFGVILVRLGGSQIEVATFRADMEYEDGRRPVGVRFTSAEEDARRRDFTINGLFLDPIEDRIIDYVGGQEDLKKGVLRAIGKPEERFHEDHLRLLRAVRFAARFSLQIEEQTAKAIEHHAPHLTRISPERIAEELRLMLTPTTRIAAWEMLWTLKLLPVILRTLPERVEKRVLQSSIFSAVAPSQPISFPLALAATVICYRLHASENHSVIQMLTPVAIKQDVHVCRVALRISNDEQEHMHQVLDLWPLLQLAVPSVALMKRFLAKPFSGDARKLLEALHHCHYFPRSIEWLLARFAELERTNIAPPPLITGDDLTAAGLQPGRLFKRILDEVYDAQLEDRIATKEDAISMAMRIARPAP